MVEMTHCGLSPALYNFRDAFERMGGVAALSLEGVILSACGDFEALFGFSEAEIVGKDIRFISPPSAQNDFHEHLWGVARNGEVVTHELQCRHKDGSPVVVRLTLSPSYGKQNEIIGFLALFQRTMALHKGMLSDLFYRYRAGFNRMAAMAVISREGVILEINDAFSALYGYGPSEIIGQKISVIGSNVTSPEVHENLWETILSGNVWGHEITNKRKDGSLICVRATIAPAVDHYIHSPVCDRKQDAYLVIYQDNSAEVEARNSRVKLAVEATRQEMMSGALHNVGNLLQSVVAATERVSDANQDLRAAIDVARQHYDGLASAIEPAKTLDAAKLAARQCNDFIAQVWTLLETCLNDTHENVQLASKSVDSSVAVLRSFREQMTQARVITEVDLRVLSHQWLEVFVPQASRHDIVFSISQVPSDVHVQWPLDWVQQILFNMLKNSKEAIVDRVAKGKPGRGLIDMSVTVDPVKGTVKIRVTDTGGGFSIPPEDRFRHGVTTKVTGSGIGLHNASIMSNTLNGSIFAENVIHEGLPGAAVELMLPLKIAQLASRA